MPDAAFPAALPGPHPAFLFGWRGNLVRFARDPIGYTTKMRQQFGDLAAFVRGGSGGLNSTFPQCPGVVFAFGPRYNQQLLTNTATFHSTLLTGLENTKYERLICGLLRMNGEQHKQQRRLMMPAFQKKRIEAYAEDIVAITRQALDTWRMGERRDLAADMRQLSLRIAGKILFGLATLEDADNMGRRIVRWLELIGSPGVLLFPWDWPYSPYRKMLRLSRRLDAAIASMIKDKRAEGQDAGDVLSMLIHSRDTDGSRMSEDELVGQATLLFMAGHETTANALAWTLFLLAQHPKVAADLHDELAGKLHGEAPTPDDLVGLPHLENVVRESMRLLPPVPFGSRTAISQVSVGTYDLPPFTEVLFSQYHTHHSPEIYAEPERFRPERWEKFEPTPYEYLPFAAGPRMCIGASLAMMEARIVLAIILQRVRLELLPRTRLDRFVNITLSPKQGLPMIVRTQDREFARSRAEMRGNIREMVECG